MFSFSKTTSPQPAWIPLTGTDQLDEIVSLSMKGGGKSGVAVFKHSTRCSISRAVCRDLNAEWDLSPELVPFYYLDLLAYRSVSDAIAQRFGVVHQSPQLIIIRDGKAVFSETHNHISASETAAFLRTEI